jgi:hypothetical protein
MIPKWASRFEIKPGAWVFVPTEETIKVGREIKKDLEVRWKPPSNYFHLIAGGHVRALRAHAGNSWFVHLDIKDFFGSINRSRITRSLKKLFGYKRAREIANASTVTHPSRGDFILPFGFVQSPLIASICLYKSALGNRLRGMQNEGLTVSVYVDDLILSANDLQVANAGLAAVKHAAERSGFRLNPDKEEGPAVKITAFNIDLSVKQLAIEQERLAAFIEAFQTAESSHQKRGILGYVASVCSAQANEIQPN